MINLQGYRTKITGWVMALAPLVALAGFGFDQAAFTAWLDQFFAVIAGAYAVGGAAVHYYRNQANKV